MITFYSGTPGSGKSLQMAQEVTLWLKVYKQNVIANTRINRDKVLKGKPGGRFFYLDNSQFTVDFLYRYALKFHELGVESQTLIVIDEAQALFSPTAVKLNTQVNQFYRKEWLDFFTQHRHLGFDILIISQFDRLIDPQIRCLFEYNYVHRKANNLGMFGKLLTIFHIKFFVQVQHWYQVKEAIGTKFFIYHKKYGDIYDSYSYRNQVVKFLTDKYGEKEMSRIMGYRLTPTEYKNKQKEKITEKKEEELREAMEKIS